MAVPEADLCVALHDGLLVSDDITVQYDGPGMPWWLHHHRVPLTCGFITRSETSADPSAHDLHLFGVLGVHPVRTVEDVAREIDRLTRANEAWQRIFG